MIGEQDPESLIMHKADFEQVAASIAFMRETFEVDDNYGPDFLHDQLRAKLSGFVLAGAPKDVVSEVRFPASWWQYTKQEIFTNPRTRLGEWLRTRFLPRMGYARNVETINRKICPHGLTEPAKRHLGWLSGPEIYTDQIEELGRDLGHWKMRARMFEHQVSEARKILDKQAEVVRKLVGQGKSS